MNISILTVFPELYNNLLNTSLIKRALNKKLININLIKFSDVCLPKERIDSPICGPAPGMLIKPQVIEKAINLAEKQYGKAFKIFMSPKGELLDQQILKDIYKELESKNLSQNLDDSERSFKNFPPHLILVASRYEGMDKRVLDFYANKIISIGDYILMGGDLPVQIFLESFLRLVPGVIGKESSVQEDSFSGALLDYPAYTLPRNWNGKDIPDIIFSGNHSKIKEYRTEEAVKDTILNKFDWFRKNNPSDNEIALAKKFIPNHYVALMHTEVVVRGNSAGNTSITSLDIHDIARSSATFGIKIFFIASKFKDQHKILNTFLDFWKSDYGKKYNNSRYEAINKIKSAYNLQDIINQIEKIEKIKPLIITTSAKTKYNYNKIIDFHSQSKIFKLNKPILIVLGTGQGLSDYIMDKSDYILLPIKGLTNYNHLSVRSAAAIILDRWLGLYSKTK